MKMKLDDEVGKMKNCARILFICFFLSYNFLFHIQRNFNFKIKSNQQYNFSRLEIDTFSKFLFNFCILLLWFYHFLSVKIIFFSALIFIHIKILTETVVVFFFIYFHILIMNKQIDGSKKCTVTWGCSCVKKCISFFFTKINWFL